MQSWWTRRRFLASASMAVAGLHCGALRGVAVKPFERTGKARLALSLAAYSMRDHFIDINRPREIEVPVSKRISLFQFMDFCARHGCQGTELTSYFFPERLTRDFLLKVRRHAFLKGLEISGTAVSNSFTHGRGRERTRHIKHVKTWIRHAAAMGAPHVRVFAGKLPPGSDARQAHRNCISALEDCAEEAARTGVFLGLENHGGIVAESKPLLEIIRAVNSPWVGINLDTGNFHTDDPYADLKACAPYAVNVQIKASIQPRGKTPQPADMRRLITMLRDVNYQGYVALEYEDGGDPYEAIPPLLEQLAQLMA